MIKTLVVPKRPSLFYLHSTLFFRPNRLIPYKLEKSSLLFLLCRKFFSKKHNPLALTKEKIGHICLYDPINCWISWEIYKLIWNFFFYIYFLLPLGLTCIGSYSFISKNESCRWLQSWQCRENFFSKILVPWQPWLLW